MRVIKQLVNFLERIGRWILESYQITIVIIPISLILWCRVELGPEKIALCGAVLQIIGTLFGIVIFNDLRKYFSKPSLFELFKSYLKRFPKWRPEVRTMSGGVVDSGNKVSGIASFWMPDDPTLSVEERIKRLVENHESLKSKLVRVEQTISDYKLESSSKFKGIEAKINSEISQVNTKLESIHMDDFLWALTGLLFILVGTIFSNFAEYLV